MTIEMLIAQIRQAMTARLEERTTHRQTIESVRGACAPAEGRAERQPTDAEADQVRSAETAIRGIDEEVRAQQARITELERELESDQAAQRLATDLARANGDPGQREHRAPARTSEERTYTARRSAAGEASFFADAYRAQQGDMAARQRLERHMVEVEREGELNGRLERAVATGGFAGLVVPQYLVELAARAIRSGRPTANAVTGLSLPAQGMSVIVPRGTTGAAATSQATENTALQNTDEVWANLNVPVVTIGGQQDVSRQSLERGGTGIDEIVYMDLAGAYHAELDRQVIAGSGASNQMLGILNTSGINAATAFAAAPTAGNFNSKVAGQIAEVAGQGAGIAPRLQIMHPRRWGWLTSLVDGQGRPLLPAQSGGPQNAMGINAVPGGYGGEGDPTSARGEYTVVGSWAGLPVTTDANVPTNVGTNLEDVDIVLDTNHALLWEDGDGMPRQLRFEQTLGASLTVKLVVYGYAAFTAGRYPQAFGKVGGVDSVAGQGLVTPTF